MPPIAGDAYRTYDEGRNRDREIDARQCRRMRLSCFFPSVIRSASINIECVISGDRALGRRVSPG